MEKQNIHLNDEVTNFLNGLNHPLKKEIEQLRLIILSANCGLSENIKWNGPNYVFNNADSVTMRVQPPTQVQLIFHRGAKVLEQPKQKIIEGDFTWLAWKENDRAVATFTNMKDIQDNKSDLSKLIKRWLSATTLK